MVVLSWTHPSQRRVMWAAAGFVPRKFFFCVPSKQKCGCSVFRKRKMPPEVLAQTEMPMKPAFPNGGTPWQKLKQKTGKPRRGEEDKAGVLFCRTKTVEKPFRSPLKKKKLREPT